MFVPMQDMTLKKLRTTFGRVAANSNLPPLRTISMVGAFPGPNGLPYDHDEYRLLKTLKMLNDCDLPLDPEFEVDVVNIHAACGGRDFLKETKPADVVVLCFIFNPPVDPPHSCNKGIFTISELHHGNNVWHDSAVRVGTKIISVYGDGGSEIGPSVFRPNKESSQFIRFEHPKVPLPGFNEPHVLRHRQYV